MFRGIRKLGLSVLGSAVAALFVAAPANADTFTGTGTASGVSIAASATFTVQNNHLILVLTNTATDAAVDPASTLTGVFFTSTATLGLGAGSATLTGWPNGSQAFVPTGTVPAWAPFSDSLGPTYAGNKFSDSGANTYNNSGNVGGEWGRSAISLGNYNYGVSSSGYSGTASFGDSTRFDTAQNLSGPVSLDGLEFGLIPFINQLPNGGSISTSLANTTNEPLGANSVTFDLGSVSGNFVTADITGVRFQYGTDTSEPFITGTPTGGEGGGGLAPLPSSAYAGMALLIGLGAFAKFGRRGLTVA